jgi:hypothetical protein
MTPENKDRQGAPSDPETRPRNCKECQESYTIANFRESSPSYFEHPSGYEKGCDEYCLKCWLGVGPKDAPAAS